MRFFTKYVLDRGVNDYKTPVEKDWMYVAKREYRYDVNVRAAADGAALGLLACMGRMCGLVLCTITTAIGKLFDLHCRVGRCAASAGALPRGCAACASPCTRLAWCVCAK